MCSVMFTTLKSIPSPAVQCVSVCTIDLWLNLISYGVTLCFITPHPPNQYQPWVYLQPNVRSCVSSLVRSFIRSLHIHWRTHIYQTKLIHSIQFNYIVRWMSEWVNLCGSRVGLKWGLHYVWLYGAPCMDLALVWVGWLGSKVWPCLKATTLFVRFFVLFYYSSLFMWVELCLFSSVI